MKHRLGSVILGLLQWVLLSFALYLYLRDLAVPVVVKESIIASGGGVWLAWLAHSRRIPLYYSIPGGLAVIGLGMLLARWVTAWQGGPAPIDTLVYSQALLFSMVSAGFVFLLRLFALQWETLGILEFLFVELAVLQAFARHRYLHLDRPRWLADWAIVHGIAPQHILMVVGIAVTVPAFLVFIRRARLWKVISGLLLLVLVALGVYYLRNELPVQRIVAKPPGANSGSSTNKNKPGHGSNNGKSGRQSAGRGKGQGNSGFGRSGASRRGQNLPVALAVLHDDYAPPSGLYFFRQQVLSRYNGVKLEVDTSGNYDGDVITRFPLEQPVFATADVAPEKFHKDMAVTMYLIMDLGQPLALDASIKLSPARNPDPMQFRMAYNTVCRVLNVPYEQLLDLHSIPPQWPDAKKRHYLAVPDDPRYKSLLHKILQGLPPELKDNDLAKTVEVITWLEDKGIYSTRIAYKDSKDPVAAFLFKRPIKGYCVHFANAAVYLLRTAGIAARVALGYVADPARHARDGTVLIMNSRAHAWPEVYFDGAGWVPFNVTPKRTEDPPPPPVDRKLERMMGKMARKKHNALKRHQPRHKRPGHARKHKSWHNFNFNFKDLLFMLLGLLGLLYLVKFVRLAMAWFGRGRRGHVYVYRAVLDRLSDIGVRRRYGESRESFAARLVDTSPTFEDLTWAHLGVMLGWQRQQVDVDAARGMMREVMNEVRRKVGFVRWVLGWLNPVGWWRVK